MLQIAIADDQPDMLDELGQMISDFFACQGVDAAIHRFDSGDSLLASGRSFDLVFLDIRMEGLSGMETARALRQAESGSVIVFVTALEDYVFDAFSVEAADYLLKPLSSTRFTQVMQRIYPRLLGKNKPCLLLPSKGYSCQAVPFSDLFYCEALNHKLLLHTADAVLTCRLRLSELADQLDGRFFPCHRSYLVNLEHVCGYVGGMALLTNHEKIPVSRLRAQAFSQAMLAYLKEGGR